MLPALDFSFSIRDDKMRLTGGSGKYRMEGIAVYRRRQSLVCGWKWNAFNLRGVYGKVLKRASSIAVLIGTTRYLRFRRLWERKNDSEDGATSIDSNSMSVVECVTFANKVRKPSLHGYCFDGRFYRRNPLTTWEVLSDLRIRN